MRSKRGSQLKMQISLRVGRNTMVEALSSLHFSFFAWGPQDPENGRGDKPSQAAAGLARFFLLAFLGKEGQCDGEQQKEREKNRFHGEF